MNKKAIANTAVLYWSNEDECYLKESPLFESVLGVGDTAEEAEQSFADLLDDAYESYLEGQVPGYAKPGRPAKGGIALNSDVRPTTKERIKELAAGLNCSTGEVVDYLLFFWEKQELVRLKQAPKPTAKNKLDSLSQRVTRLEGSLRVLKKTRTRS